MKTSKLIKLLQKADPTGNKHVLLASDMEGNNYGLCSEIVSNNSSWNENDCALGITKLTPELENKGYSEEDVVKGKEVIVLYPNC